MDKFPFDRNILFEIINIKLFSDIKSEIFLSDLSDFP